MFATVALLIALALCACNDGDRPKVALYGNSIIAGMKGAPVVFPFDKALNMGIVGNAASQIADRVEPVADFVFLAGGINSLGGGNGRESVVESYRRSLVKLHSVQVRIIGVLPVDEHAGAPAGVTNDRIAAINLRLVALCHEFANCQPVVELMCMDMDGLTDGGVHPKRTTYMRMSEIMAKYLR